MLKPSIFRLLSFFLLISLAYNVPLGAQPNVAGSGKGVELTTGKYIDLGNSLSALSVPFSVCFWFKETSPGNHHRFFVSNANTSDYYGTWVQYINGSIAISLGDGSGRASFARRTGITNFSFVTGRWYHFSFVVGAHNNIDIYVDGVPLVVSYTGSGTVANLMTSSPSYPAYIGRGSGGAAYQYANGVLDEFSLWSKALSQTEVRDLMCKKLSGNEAGLLRYFRFDEAAGTTVLNGAPSGSDGTLIGGAQRVRSGAALGDHSIWAYTTAASPISLSTVSATGDLIDLNTAPLTNAGIHVYTVDTFPDPTAGLSIPSGQENYFGIFTTGTPTTYNFTYRPDPALAAATSNNLELRERFSNEIPVWTGGIGPANPTINENNRLGRAEFALSTIGCINGFSLGNDTVKCPEDSIFLGSMTPVIGAQYTWSTGSPNTGIYATIPGSYWLERTDPDGCVYSDTVLVQDHTVPVFDPLPAHINQCDSVLLDVPAFYNVWWDDGSTANNRWIMSSGNYWVATQDPITGCIVYDSISVNLINLLITPGFLGSDTTICGNASFSFSAPTIPSASYTWSNGSSSQTIIVSQSATVWCLISVNGCSLSDTIVVEIDPLTDQLLTEEELTLCDTVDITTLSFSVNNPPAYASFLWNNGSMASSTNFSNYGVHWVVAYKPNGCMVSDTIRLLRSSPAFIEYPQDAQFCEENGPVYFPKPEGAQEVLWPNGSDTSYTVVNSEIVRVLLSDGCFDTTYVFNVELFDCVCEVYMPDAFTPNGDGLNETFGQVSACTFSSFEMYIYNRWGGLIFHTNNPNDPFTGTDHMAGTYFYHVLYQTLNNRPFVKKGYFSLIR